MAMQEGRSSPAMWKPGRLQLDVRGDLLSLSQPGSTPGTPGMLKSIARFQARQQLGDVSELIFPLFSSAKP